MKENNFIADKYILNAYFKAVNILGIFPWPSERKLLKYWYKILSCLLTVGGITVNSIYLYIVCLSPQGDNTLRFLYINSFVLNYALSILMSYTLLKEEHSYEFVMQNIVRIDYEFGRDTTFEVNRKTHIFILLTINAIYLLSGIITSLLRTDSLGVLCQIYYLCFLYQFIYLIMTFNQITSCLRRRYDALNDILISTLSTHEYTSMENQNNKIKRFKKVYKLLNHTIQSINLIFGKYILVTFLMAYFNFLVGFTYVTFHMNKVNWSILVFFLSQGIHFVSIHMFFHFAWFH